MSSVERLFGERGESHPTRRSLVLEQLEPRILLSGPDPALEVFGTSPAVFVENQGQWDEAVRYAHQGSGANVLHTDAGPVFELFQHSEGEDGEQTTLATSFSVTFDGAGTVTPTGQDQSSGHFNYFLGDPSAWVSEVPGYETVAYEGLYEGIDLLTWGQRDSLKYEFHVAPGVDSDLVRITYNDVQGLWLDGDGVLHVETELGELTDDAPYIYQDIGGERVEVAGAFELVDSDTVRFAITGDYDPTLQLVIDPDLDWSTYLGGSSYDYGRGIAVDAGGDVYVTGYTSSSGWVSGGFDESHNGVLDAFVAKLTGEGAHAWSTYLGGSGSDYGYGIAVDDDGDVYVTGYTGSSGWVSGGFDESYNGNGDAFVAKLTGEGAHAWSTYLGGSGGDSGYGIAAGGDGGVYVTGYTSSSGWVSGGFDESHNGYYDAFVAKLTGEGAHAWSTYLGGSDDDLGRGIAVDDDGDVYVTGYTLSSGWVSGGFDESHNGGWDAFVAKLTDEGAHAWSTYMGGSDDDLGLGIAAGGDGGVYVTGYTSSSGWVSGGFDESHNGVLDAFVAKIDTNSPPEITLGEPAPGTLLSLGEIHTITWTDSDPDDDAQITLYWDKDTNPANNAPGEDGVNWGTIATGISEDDPADSYDWTVDARPNGHSYLYAVIDDGAAREEEDYTTNTLDIAVARWSSNPLVSVYDMAGEVDIDSSDISVKFGKGGSVSSIKLGGTQAMGGLGIVIEGSSTVGSIKDGRKGAKGDVAFIATDASIKSISLKSGTTGADLNGRTLGDLTFDADIDGDGKTDDETAIYSEKHIGKLGYSCEDGAIGTIWIGGSDPKKGLSLGSLSNKSGGYQGDLVTGGGVGKVSLRGNFEGSMNLGGSLLPAVQALSSLSIKGGGLGGTVQVNGGIGKVSVSDGSVTADIDVGGGIKGLSVKGGNFAGSLLVGAELGKFDVKGGKGGGGRMLADSFVQVGGPLKKGSIAGYENDNAGDEFGISAGSVSKLRLGALKLGQQDLPYVDGDFAVRPLP